MGHGRLFSSQYCLTTTKVTMAVGKVIALIFAVCVAVALAARKEEESQGAAPEPEAQTKGFGAPFLGGYHGYAAPFAYGGAYGHPGFYGHGYGYGHGYWG